MSRVVINYDVLSDIASYASKISKKADSYADDLTKKVLNKFDDITGGASSSTSDAKYYVNAKIKSLREKHNAYSSLSTKITNFSEKAQRIDKDVEQTIARNQEKFLQKHEHLRIDEWKANILNWLVDLKNSCPLFELVGNALRDLGTAVSDMFAEIKHWYECEGGKELVGVGLAVLGAVVALAILITSIPALLAASTFAAVFVAVCSTIGAAIGVLNAANNLVTSFMALHAKKNEDPAWAKIYSNRDKLSDTLRQVNFGNKFLNRLTNIGANTLDTVELFCDVVSIVDGIASIYKSTKNSGFLDYFKEAKYQEVDDFDIWGNKVGKKWTLKVDENGIVETRYTFRSIRRGFSNFIGNKPVSDYSEKGLQAIFGFDLDSIGQTLRYKGKQSPFRGIFAEGINRVRGDNVNKAAKTLKSVFNGLDKFNNGKFGDGLWEFGGAFFNHSEVFGVADDIGDVVSAAKKIFGIA